MVYGSIVAAPVIGYQDLKKNKRRHLSKFISLTIENCVPFIFNSCSVMRQITFNTT